MSPHQLHCETEKSGLLCCSVQHLKARHKQNIVSRCFINTGFDPGTSRACLAERFSAKNGDPPEAGKFWENRFFTGKMDHQGQKNAQVDDTICQGPRRTCQNFFSFTIVAVGVTFLMVILKLFKNVLKSNFRISPGAQFHISRQQFALSL